MKIHSIELFSFSLRHVFDLIVVTIIYRVDSPRETPRHVARSMPDNQYQLIKCILLR
jgi:hypothetical protein